MSGRAEIRVEGAAGLQPGQAQTFAFTDADGEPAEGFVLCVPGPPPQLVAYENRCAHVGVDLDMGTGRFWSAKTSRIYCMTHGARYEPTTGTCDAGPCVGARLRKFALRVEGNDVWVQVAGS